jgi:hypothetical protein
VWLVRVWVQGVTSEITHLLGIRCFKLVKRQTQ